MEMIHSDNEFDELEEDLQSLLKESNKKIKEVSKREKENSVKTTEYLIESHLDMPSTSASRIVIGEGKRSSSIDMPSFKERRIHILKDLDTSEDDLPEKKTRDGSESKYEVSSKPKLQSSSRGRVPRPASKSRDASLSEDSVDTVKKHSPSKSAKKKKLKHKIAVAMFQDRPETHLFKHFVEVGEWRKVHRPEDAQFTYVCNERKLDWDISLRTMVGSSHADQQSPWRLFPREKARARIRLQQIPGAVLRRRGAEVLP